MHNTKFVIEVHETQPQCHSSDRISATASCNKTVSLHLTRYKLLKQGWDDQSYSRLGARKLKLEGCHQLMEDEHDYLVVKIFKAAVACFLSLSLSLIIFCS